MFIPNRNLKLLIPLLVVAESVLMKPYLIFTLTSENNMIYELK